MKKCFRQKMSSVSETMKIFHQKTVSIVHACDRNVMPREAAGFVKICASSVQNVVDSIIAGRESRMDQQNL